MTMIDIGAGSDEKVSVQFSYDMYVAADTVARAEGSSIYAELREFLLGKALRRPDLLYKTDEVLPGETVCRTPAESKAHLDAILAKAGIDV